MKEQNKKYIDFDELLKKDEKNLNSIYKDLLKNNEDKNAIKKFDHIVKSKIDYRGLLPCTKSYEGENLLTLSKTWMIIILININKGKSQKDKFLTLVNSSLTHELNEYEEYKYFYEEQCEILFSEEEAIRRINLNPKLLKKIDDSISHDELKKYYIYLLFKPNYFKKIELEEMSKFKRKGKNEKDGNEGNIKTESNKRKNKTPKNEDIKIESETDSENDEKGDRLDENDMISKNRLKKSSYGVRAENKKKNNSNINKVNKRKSEKDDKDYKIINDIINKRIKSENKKDKKKSIDESVEEDEDIEMEDLNEIEKGRKNKNKKKIITKEKKNRNIKNNKKYEEEIEEEDEEEEDKKKKSKNKKEKEKKYNKKEEKKKNRTSANKIFELLGLDTNLIEEEEEVDDDNDEKKKKKEKISKDRKSISVEPKNKKENSNNKKIKEHNNKKESYNKKESNNKKESKNKKEKEKKKGGRKTKNNKKKKSKSDDDDDDFLSDDEILSLTDLNDNFSSDNYEDNLDNLNEDENEKLEREIKAALEENYDELELEELLSNSKMEGINLSQLESKTSEDLDLD